MEIRVLRYFLTVAREGSFSKAAQVLNVTQPTLSRQIKELEDEYHITLFERTTRSVSLTQEGSLFKEQAREIISLVEKMESRLRQRDLELSGDIHIGCRPSCGPSQRHRNTIPASGSISTAGMPNMSWKSWTRDPLIWGS